MTTINLAEKTRDDYYNYLFIKYNEYDQENIVDIINDEENIFREIYELACVNGTTYYDIIFQFWYDFYHVEDIIEQLQRLKNQGEFIKLRNLVDDYAKEIKEYYNEKLQQFSDYEIFKSLYKKLELYEKVKLVEKCKTIEILSFRKIEERMCYDAWWEVETNLEKIRLHTYDGIGNEDMAEKLDKCYNIADIKKLNAKCFYFD